MIPTRAALVAVVPLLAGCPGEVDPGPVAVDASAERPCAPRAVVPDDGYHNPGMDCQSGCHNHGYTVSGTVYTGATNDTGFAGATVRITDANNQLFELVTSANGNFHSYAPVAFPATVEVSACPDTTAMPARLRSPTEGRCNAVGCHAQSSRSQIHLP